MPTPYTVKVTRDILELSKECGTHNDIDTIGSNCAIALALKEIFPDIFVSDQHIYPFGIDENNETNNLTIPMPKIARDFVRVFDSLSAVHNLRPRLPEFEFSIDLPDAVIAEINIDEVKEIRVLC
jgi:hypothetical protein